MSYYEITTESTRAESDYMPFDFSRFASLRSRKPQLPKHPHLEPGTYTLMKDVRKITSPATDEAIAAAAQPTEEVHYYLKPTVEGRLPSKIYGDPPILVPRFLKSYQDRKKKNQSTGIMLSGLKGSGKTLTGKLLSQKMKELGGITILINKNYFGDEFTAFLQSIDQECLVIFDEFEKVYPYGSQKKILTLFSGINSANKLFCLMVNDRNAVEENMNDRPDRLRYNIHFGDMSQKSIEEYLVDKNVAEVKENLDKFQALRDSGATLSFDMVQAIVEEMDRFGEDVYSAAQYIVAPKMKEKDVFSIEIEGGPVEFKKDNLTYSMEQIIAGPKLSFIFQAPSDSSSFMSRHKPAASEETKETKAEDPEAAEKKKLEKEFKERIKGIDLQAHHLVSSDRVRKRFEFEYEELTIIFTSDNSNRKNPNKERNRYYDSY